MMTMENPQSDQLLELSNQELDNVAGGATNAVSADNESFSDLNFGFVEIPAEGGIKSVTIQETLFSQQELDEFKELDAL